MVTSCPSCGAELAAVDLGGDTPPWLCAPCARGWWPAELTAKARAAWRPLLRTFDDPDGKIALARDAQHDGRVAAKGGGH